MRGSGRKTNDALIPVQPEGMSGKDGLLCRKDCPRQSVVIQQVKTFSDWFPLLALNPMSCDARHSRTPPIANAEH
jgi:hypothetical protein